MKLSKTAEAVLKKRYFLKDSKGNAKETPEQMFRRAAKEIAKADSRYGQDSKKAEKEFFDAMSSLDFLPNSPTLMNAGTEIPQLSACFVLPVEDSMESIFNALKSMALIHQSGGGVGFSFSRLRPEGEAIKTAGGVSSGPVSFIKIFETATDVIKSGGRRRGANMGVLNVGHPDILKFVNAKKEGDFSNFNFSVGISDSFMKDVVKKKSGAVKIFDSIVENAWKTGDPGILFLDEINRKHTLNENVEATNPCGEQPLLPYESCNLGSINLSNMVVNGSIDWKKIRRIVHVGVHFLDNAIDINKYPLPEIEAKTKQSRKIGLGVMGFAEMLIKIGVKYDSVDAVAIAERVMMIIQKEAKLKSSEIGKRRGSFPLFRKSRIKGYRQMRNATTTTIAPTGTISLIAGTSSGIEPLFALKFTREILGGKKFVEENPLWKSGKYKKQLFVTAMDIKPEQHVRVQAAFQRFTDNAVSKTVNLPGSASRADVRKIFMLAYKLKCKGITVYRYASKENQVLNVCETC